MNENLDAVRLVIQLLQWYEQYVSQMDNPMIDDEKRLWGDSFVEAVKKVVAGNMMAGGGDQASLGFGMQSEELGLAVIEIKFRYRKPGDE